MRLGAFLFLTLYGAGALIVVLADGMKKGENRLGRSLAESNGTSCIDDPTVTPGSLGSSLYCNSMAVSRIAFDAQLRITRTQQAIDSVYGSLNTFNDVVERIKDVITFCELFSNDFLSLIRLFIIALAALPSTALLTGGEVFLSPILLGVIATITILLGSFQALFDPLEQSLRELKARLEEEYANIVLPLQNELSSVSSKLNETVAHANLEGQGLKFSSAVLESTAFMKPLSYLLLPDSDNIEATVQHSEQSVKDILQAITQVDKLLKTAEETVNGDEWNENREDISEAFSTIDRFIPDWLSPLQWGLDLLQLEIPLALPLDIRPIAFDVTCPPSYTLDSFKVSCWRDCPLGWEEFGLLSDHCIRKCPNGAWWRDVVGCENPNKYLRALIQTDSDECPQGSSDFFTEWFTKKYCRKNCNPGERTGPSLAITPNTHCFPPCPAGFTPYSDDQVHCTPEKFKRTADPVCERGRRDPFNIHGCIDECNAVSAFGYCFDSTPLGFTWKDLITLILDWPFAIPWWVITEIPLFGEAVQGLHDFFIEVLQRVVDLIRFVIPKFPTRRDLPQPISVKPLDTVFRNVSLNLANLEETLDFSASAALARLLNIGSELENSTKSKLAKVSVPDFSKDVDDCNDLSCVANVVENSMGLDAASGAGAASAASQLLQKSHSAAKAIIEELQASMSPRGSTDGTSDVNSAVLSTSCEYSLFETIDVAKFLGQALSINGTVASKSESLITVPLCKQLDGDSNTKWLNLLRELRRELAPTLAPALEAIAARRPGAAIKKLPLEVPILPILLEGGLPWGAGKGASGDDVGFVDELQSDKTKSNGTIWEVDATPSMPGVTVVAVWWPLTKQMTFELRATAQVQVSVMQRTALSDIEKRNLARTLLLNSFYNLRRVIGNVYAMDASLDAKCLREAGAISNNDTSSRLTCVMGGVAGNNQQCALLCASYNLIMQTAVVLRNQTDTANFAQAVAVASGDKCSTQLLTAVADVNHDFWLEKDIEYQVRRCAGWLDQVAQNLFRAARTLQWAEGKKGEAALTLSNIMGRVDLPIAVPAFAYDGNVTAAEQQFYQFKQADRRIAQLDVTIGTARDANPAVNAFAIFTGATFSQIQISVDTLHKSALSLGSFNMRKALSDNLLWKADNAVHWLDYKHIFENDVGSKMKVSAQVSICMVGCEDGTFPPTFTPTTRQPTPHPTTAAPTKAPTTLPPYTARPTRSPTTKKPTSAPTTREPSTLKLTDSEMVAYVGGGAGGVIVLVAFVFLLYKKDCATPAMETSAELTVHRAVTPNRARNVAGQRPVRPVPPVRPANPYPSHHAKYYV